MNIISLISFLRRPEFSLTRRFLTPDFAGLIKFQIAILLRSLFGSHRFAWRPEFVYRNERAGARNSASFQLSSEATSTVYKERARFNVSLEELLGLKSHGSLCPYLRKKCYEVNLNFVRSILTLCGLG